MYLTAGHEVWLTYTIYIEMTIYLLKTKHYMKNHTLSQQFNQLFKPLKNAEKEQSARKCTILVIRNAFN